MSVDASVVATIGFISRRIGMPSECPLCLFALAVPLYGITVSWSHTGHGQARSSCWILARLPVSWYSSTYLVSLAGYQR